MSGPSWRTVGRPYRQIALPAGEPTAVCARPNLIWKFGTSIDLGMCMQWHAARIEISIMLWVSLWVGISILTRVWCLSEYPGYESVEGICLSGTMLKPDSANSKDMKISLCVTLNEVTLPCSPCAVHLRLTGMRVEFKQSE